MCLIVFFELIYSVHKHLVCNFVRHKIDILYRESLFYYRSKLLPLNLKVGKLCRQVYGLVKRIKLIYLVILSVGIKQYKCAVGNYLAVKVILFYLREYCESVAERMGDI